MVFLILNQPMMMQNFLKRAMLENIFIKDS